MKECNSIKQSPIAALAAYGGGAGGTTFTGGSTEALYVDDVFSTYVYEGQNTSTNTINNGLDLAGEGGLVWIKRRDGVAINHYWFDTERTNKYLNSNNDSAQFDAAASSYINSYTSTGFVTGDSANIGWQDFFVSWSFRKAPKFFDVVTYTGTGSARTVAHNLGSVPGMMIIKCTSEDKDWSVYHRSMGATKNAHLNNTSQHDTQTGVFNDTEPTATNFTVNYDGDVNKNGATYVAYLFAHDEQSFGTDSDEAIIKCGTYEGNGGTQEINLGFEPQWLMLKNIDNTAYGGDWIVVDIMRGFEGFGISGDSKSLCANLTSAEPVNSGRVKVTSQGFVFDGESNHDYNNSGDTFIYMAIRRPNKPVEAGTDVFTSVFRDASEPVFNSAFPVDLAFEQWTSGSSSYPAFGTRLTGRQRLVTSSTAAETTNTTYDWDYQDGWNNFESTSYAVYAQMFKRAPGFLDVLSWKGNNTVGRTLPHNLESTPELMIIKSRSSAYDWVVWHKDFSGSEYVYLNEDRAKASTENFFNNTTPDASNITFSSSGYTNGTGETYTGALFATLSGISKVGSYTGTGYDIDVDCGFTAGARYILIKRTDSTGDWYVWDSLRGIYSDTTNDPYLLLNSSGAHQTNNNYVDALNAGFTVNAAAPAGLNANGGTYLFFAVA